MTEVILYKQQLVANGKFAIDSDYGWTITGAWTASNGHITKLPGLIGSIYQENILLYGVDYKLKFTTTGRTAGTLTVKCGSGLSTIVSTSSNQKYEINFTSDGTGILFDSDSSWDGAISNVSIIEIAGQYKLDVTEKIAIPLNFSIDNVFNLDERRSTFSKQIDIPGTHNNNIAFGHVYKINSSSKFDTRKQSRCVIKNKGLQVFDGILFLDNILTTFIQGNESIIYKVTLIGEVFNVFDKFSNKSIKDLDFSKWDHPMDIQTVIYNTGADVSTGSPYIIDPAMTYNWDNEVLTYMPSQTIDYTSSAITAITSETFNGNACVGVQFTLSHSFSVGDTIYFNTDNPYLIGTHVIAAIAAANKIVLHMAYANAVSTSIAGGSRVEKRTWHAEGYWYPMIDNGHFKTELNTGETIYNGYLYTFKHYNPFDNFAPYCYDPASPATPMTPVTGMTFLASDGSSAPGIPIDMSIDWGFNTVLETYTEKNSGGTLTNKNKTANQWFLQDFIPCIYAREVWIKMFELIDYEYDLDIIDSNLFRRLVIPMDSKFNVNELGTSSPDHVIMNTWLPDMKLKDFFISILNMFDLVILEDRDQKNLLKFKSRNDFFNGTTVNWELDATKELKVTMASTLLPRYFTLKYKDGNDFYNVDYNNEFGNITNASGILNAIDRKYGDRYIPTYNQAKDTSKKVELYFEPTVMAGSLPGIYDQFNPGHGQDKVFSVTYSADSKGENVSRNSANRILIAGVRGTAFAWGIYGNYPKLAERFDVQQNALSGRQYPYAMHIDNIFDAVPWVDLNFDPILGRYFPLQPSGEPDIEKWAANCLSGMYWNRYLNDILSPNSRLVSGTFKISTMNIHQLDFQNIWECLDFQMKLSKIIDWDVNGDGLTRAEFLLKNA